MTFAFKPLVGSLLLAGCSLFGLGAHAADVVKVQLDWLPGGDKSFVYAGVKQGFFAAEGLDVTVLPGRGSTDAVTKIGTGAADVGFGGISALMMANAESVVPVKAVMSLYAKQPDAIFTTKTSGITSLKDLSGKTVATSTFSSSNQLWPVVLQKNGIDPASIKLLKVDPATLAPMLAQGKVDATINWVTVAPGVQSVVKQAGKDLSVLPWSAYGLDGYGWSAMASEKMITERPEVLKRYLRALKKSLDFALANPEKAAADLKAMVPEADEAVAAAEFRASMPLLQNEVTKANGMGVFEPKLLAATWGWVAASMNYAPTKVNPEALVDRGFLPK
jgi:NitT/TauT family transport system substrate-binding protein